MEKIQEMLLAALEQELVKPGEEVRTWLIDHLVDNLLKIQQEKQEAPQVQAEELDRLVISVNLGDQLIGAISHPIKR